MILIKINGELCESEKCNRDRNVDRKEFFVDISMGKKGRRVHGSEHR